MKIRLIPRVSLRLPWAMRLLGFQPAHFAPLTVSSACPLRLPWTMRLLGFQPARFACPGLCAHWALLCIIGFTSAIQACLIAFGLNGHSARLKLNPKL